INECTEGSHDCHRDATCQNTVGSYRNKSYKSRSPYRCDNKLNTMWYRFTGAAENPHNGKTFENYTRFEWGVEVGVVTTFILRLFVPHEFDMHPSKEDGRVNRRVYFRSFSNCEEVFNVVKVRNCGPFFVYFIRGTAPGTSNPERDIYSDYQMMLKGHTYKTIKVRRGSLDCRQACLADTRCRSYNVLFIQQICELTNSTKEASPDDFIWMNAPQGFITATKTRSVKTPQGRLDASASQASTAPTKASKSNSTECLHYVTLQNADRKATYVASQQPFLCDYDLDAMWYRFEGAAGTKMPTTCVGPSSCGATRPGWMNGAHPTVEDGRVNREVCFRSWHECCKYTKSNMVRNCGSFYVYHLDGIATNCSEAYCATD
ncbi:hypothetical protein pdam_00021433, partial [Pocillopora damicornis]